VPRRRASRRYRRPFRIASSTARGSFDNVQPTILLAGFPRTFLLCFQQRRERCATADVCDLNSESEFPCLRSCLADLH
jgi:hypothetical protein